ncbi:MAG: ribbon-helix-helix domain-containing protein [Candidatus Saccharibacteria bacterium]|jgi:metal-responsive CopG/Arc/MetJ family transcriptional regulator
MNKKIVNLSLPEDLLKRVDAAAKKEYSSRSDFVRLALLNQLRTQNLEREYQDFNSIYGTTLKALADK